MLEPKGLKLDRDAVSYLADRVEGNLLAAVQELDKLALLTDSQSIDVETLISCIEDVSRYNVFDLLDAMMAADPARVVKIAQALREEGVSVFAILGALTSQLRSFGGYRKLPPARQKLSQQFSARIRNTDSVLAECAVVDQMGKGQLGGDAWVALERLLLRLASLRSVSLPSQDQRILQVGG